MARRLLSDLAMEWFHVPEVLRRVTTVTSDRGGWLKARHRGVELMVMRERSRVILLADVADVCAVPLSRLTSALDGEDGALIVSGSVVALRYQLDLAALDRQRLERALQRIARTVLGLRARWLREAA